MIELTVIDGALRAETWDDSRDDLAAATRAWLIDQGADPWEVDGVMPRFRYEHCWWSPSYGGRVHDCAGHLPEETDPAQCFPDTRQVTLVCEIPPTWLGQDPGAPE